jgi:hypothetical protein
MRTCGRERFEELDDVLEDLNTRRQEMAATSSGTGDGVAS